MLGGRRSRRPPLRFARHDPVLNALAERGGDSLQKSQRIALEIVVFKIMRSQGAQGRNEKPPRGGAGRLRSQPWRNHSRIAPLWHFFTWIARLLPRPAAEDAFSVASYLYEQ